ncbi:hypothetical protein Sjap_010942 [Stephania japonica]|uniref:Uncharacterized protein n=1 Tax=Stephania japonica TaxID=461633 RepID=A0AAP0JC98_9MAGN
MDEAPLVIKLVSYQQQQQPSLNSQLIGSATWIKFFYCARFCAVVAFPNTSNISWSMRLKLTWVFPYKQQQQQQQQQHSLNLKLLGLAWLHRSNSSIVLDLVLFMVSFGNHLNPS